MDHKMILDAGIAQIPVQVNRTVITHFLEFFFMNNRTAFFKIVFQFAKQRNGCLIYLFKNYVFFCTSVRNHNFLKMFF